MFKNSIHLALYTEILCCLANVNTLTQLTCPQLPRCWERLIFRNGAHPATDQYRNSTSSFAPCIEIYAHYKAAAWKYLSEINLFYTHHRYNVTNIRVFLIIRAFRLYYEALLFVHMKDTGLNMVLLQFPYFIRNNRHTHWLYHRVCLYECLRLKSYDMLLW